jgi:hypothetical protein
LCLRERAEEANVHWLIWAVVVAINGLPVSLAIIFAIHVLVATIQGWAGRKRDDLTYALEVKSRQLAASTQRAKNLAYSDETSSQIADLTPSIIHKKKGSGYRRLKP